jgi:hypothetical protein
MVGRGYWLLWDGILREFAVERANGIAGLASDEVR